MRTNNIATTQNYMIESSSKSPIILKQYVSEKAARLLWGKSYTILSEDPVIQDWLEEFLEVNRMEFLFLRAEKVLSQIGRQVVVLDKLANGSIRVSLTNPNQYSRVGKYYEEEVAFEGYRYTTQGDNSYLVRTTMSEGKIKTDFFNVVGDIVRISEANFTIPPEWKLAPELSSEYEFIKGNSLFLPVVEMINLPFLPANQTGVGNAFPDDFYCSNLQEQVDKVWEVLDKELNNNITRVFADIPQSELDRLKKDEVIGKYIDTFIIRGQGVIGDGGAQINILQGDPLLEGYHNHIKNIINLYVEMCGYSPEQNSLNKRTEAEALFTKTNDVETTKMKRKLRTLDWMRVFDKALVYAGVWDGIGKRPYTFEINENIVVDELQMTNILITQLNSGLISRIDAIAKLKGIDIEEAKLVKESIFESMKDDEAQGFGILKENQEQEQDAMDHQGEKNKNNVKPETE